MSNKNFNPLLVHAITNRPLEEIAASPSISDLPGDLARLVTRHIDQAPRVFPKNELIFICKSCKKRGRYDMGHVSIDIDSFEKNRDMPIETHMQHTGYFRCKQCNSAGKWGVIIDYKLRIIAQLMQITATGEVDDLFSIGKNQLYDGSEHQYASDAEEHLLQKIIQTPTNSFLWNRLANMYYMGSRADLAAATFEHSLSLNNMQTESYYSLGMILENIDPEKAIHYYHKMMASARYYHDIDAHQLRDLLAATFNNLMHLQLERGGQLMSPSMDVFEELKIEFPKPDRNQSTKVSAEIELDDLESFYPFAEVFMGDRKKELRRGKRYSTRRNK